MLFAALSSGALFSALLAFPISAQSVLPPAATPADCEAGFERRIYPHGSQLNFRCRTRVIDCPERPGHHAAVIPEPSFETAQGVQFGYRCQYSSRER
jgi:hypothetical protein